MDRDGEEIGSGDPGETDATQSSEGEYQEVRWGTLQGKNGSELRRGGT